MSGSDPKTGPPKPGTSETVPVYDLADLIGPTGQLKLNHNDEEYDLRITRAGKLILTK